MGKLLQRNERANPDCCHREPSRALEHCCGSVVAQRPWHLIAQQRGCTSSWLLPLDLLLSTCILNSILSEKSDSHLMEIKIFVAKVAVNALWKFACFLCSNGIYDILRQKCLKRKRIKKTTTMMSL